MSPKTPQKLTPQTHAVPHLSHALPKLAGRTAHIAPFQVMELVKQAAALQLQGAPVIHMSIGEPDFTAPPAVLAALDKAARAGRTQYTSALGIAPLRDAISKYYKNEYGLEIAPSRIIVTAGASAALTLACCALVNPGDEVLLTDPSYPCNRHFIASYDGKPKLVPVGPETRFQMTRELLDKHWGKRTVGALLATPANPTGTSIPFDELRSIVEGVRSHGGFTIVDEIYLGLSYADTPGQSPEVHSALELGDDIIVTNSFSKFFNMTGWRLGWLVVPEALTASFEKLAQNLFICASTLAQYAALACFEPATMDIFRERRALFDERRRYIVPAMRELGFGVPVEPDGAFYVYLDVQDICKRLGLSGSSELAQVLLHKANVCIVPGADFGHHHPEHYMRLSYATELSQLKEAVQRIRSLL